MKEKTYFEKRYKNTGGKIVSLNEMLDIEKEEVLGMIEDNDKKLGIHFYTSYTFDNDKCIGKKLEIGFYIRSHNPFNRYGRYGKNNLNRLDKDTALLVIDFITGGKKLGIDI